jgi:hypothetical protein
MLSRCCLRVSFMLLKVLPRGLLRRPISRCLLKQWTTAV